MRHSELLARADVMVYLTSSTGEKAEVDVLRETFRDQSLTVHLRENPGYEAGAMAAMKDAMVEDWFRGYDWVVRLNPDVIIRNDTFLLRTMTHDRTATGVLIDCDREKSLSAINTDFFAIKPSALGKDAFLNVSMEGGQTVEGHFARDVRESIIDKGNHRWMPGSQPTWHTCRAGFGRDMATADVVHVHMGADLSRPWAKMPEPDEGNTECQSRELARKSTLIPASTGRNGVLPTSINRRTASTS
ncbi:hypothetical protein ACHAXT_006032 [Thalassiosira profunda]